MNCTECGSDHSGQRTEYPTGDLVIVTGDFTGGIDITLYNPAIHTADNAPRVPIPTGSLGRVVGHCDDGRALIVFDAEKGKSTASHSFHFPGGYFVSVRKLEALPTLLAALREPCSQSQPDFATDLELLAQIIENEGFSGDLIPASLRAKAATIRAAIAAAEGVER